MLEKLSSALKKATDKIVNTVLLDKNLVESIVRELQRALIEADVNVQLVISVSDKLRKIAYDERIKGIEKKEQLIKALHDEIKNLLGKEKAFNTTGKQRIMLVGLYGAGKTTTAGKLAHYYSKRGLKVAAISLDVHRPAAAEQLKQLGQKLNFPVFTEPQEKKPNLIWKKNVRELDKYDLVFIDTAGRDALDDELIVELKAITKEVKPSETLLVMPADVGQTAKKQTQVFKESTSLTGVIITRMDSTAKAGGALTACAEANVPIIFIGTGEKANELEQFNPEAFVSRLLGMGDLKGLVEKIESVTNKKELEKTRENLESGKFTLRDLQAQLESMEQIGSFDKVLSMIPGLGKAKIPEEALTSQQEKVKKWKHAINSMTPEEIESPELLEKQTTRMARIAKGSGVSVGEIRSLIKQYRLLKEMIKSGGPLKTEGELDQKTLMKMAKKFGRKMKF